jgi:hypothetical protein
LRSRASPLTLTLTLNNHLEATCGVERLGNARTDQLQNVSQPITTLVIIMVRVRVRVRVRVPKRSG